MRDYVESDVLEIGDAKVVVFGANWCGPCKLYKKQLKGLAESNPELDLIYVDVDKHPELVRQFEVQSVPVTVCFNDVEVIQFTGIQPDTNILSAINM